MKRTKTKLISSITVLIVCFAMLIGSTFAWFTDSASTGVNTIQAGNLDIKVEYLSNLANDTWTEVDVNKKLFNDDALWEPGYAEVAYLKITNAGSLHLKYKLSVNVNDEVTGTSVNNTPIKLSEILKFGKVLTPIDGTLTVYPKTIQGREQAIAAVSDSTTPLTAYSNENLDLAPGASEYVTLVVYMPSTVGNEANYRGGMVPSIKLGLDVVATQARNETDSFDNQYDKNALYPILASVINNTKGKSVSLNESGSTGNEEIQIIDTNATSKIPANTTLYADDGSTAVAINDSGTLNREIRTTESSIDSVTYDISYKYIAQNGTSTDVTKFSGVVENIIGVSTGLNVVKVTRSHGLTTTEMTPANDLTTKADGTYYYDSQNGKIYVWSSLYSSFKVEYENDFVAATDGQGYGTLNEALTAVKDNGNVILLKDITLNNDLQIGTGSKNINLNLNTKTIDGGSYQVYTAGVGTIKIFGDGTIKNNNTEKNSNCAALYIMNRSDVILDGVTVEGYYGVYTCGNLAINEATINAVDVGIAINESAQVNVGTETKHNIFVNASYGNCISTQAANGNPEMVVDIYGGTFISSGTNWKMCPIYWTSHGTLNVYGGSFANSTSGTEAAGLYQKNGIVNIYDGAFESRSGLKVEAEGTNSTGITMNIFGGTFTGLTHAALYYKTQATGLNCTTFNINVFNGTFNGNNEKGAIYKSVADGVIKPSISVTGGRFSSDPSQYITEDYTVLNTEGLYEVKKLNIAKVSNEEELLTALDQTDLDGIKLLNDITIDTPNTILNNAVIDLCNHIITLNNDLQIGDNDSSPVVMFSDGSIESQNNKIRVLDGSNLTLDNVTVKESETYLKEFIIVQGNGFDKTTTFIANNCSFENSGINIKPLSNGGTYEIEISGCNLSVTEIENASFPSFENIISVSGNVKGNMSILNSTLNMSYNNKNYVTRYLISINTLQPLNVNFKNNIFNLFGFALPYDFDLTHEVNLNYQDENNQVFIDGENVKLERYKSTLDTTTKTWITKGTGIAFDDSKKYFKENISSTDKSYYLIEYSADIINEYYVGLRSNNTFTALNKTEFDENGTITKVAIRGKNTAAKTIIGDPVYTSDDGCITISKLS